MQHYNQYNPFGKVASDNPDNHWGIVVILEDAFINRDLYYRYAFSELNTIEGPSIASWIKKHICVASLYEIETFCYYPQDLICIMKKRSREKEYGFSFIHQYRDTSNSVNAIEFFSKFKNETIASLNALSEELVQKGFFAP